MSIQIVRSLSVEPWRTFVEQNPNGNIFHTPEMFEVFKRTRGFKPELWAAVDNGQVLVLFLPVQITLINSLLARLTTRSVAYGSILYASEDRSRTALGMLLETYTAEKKGKFLFSELRNLHNMDASRAILERSGFAYEDHLNYLIDLTLPPEKLFRSLTKSARKSINRSIRRGAVAEEIRDHSSIPEYYDLLNQTYTRAKVPLADISLFEAVLDILVPKGMAKMFLTRVDGHGAAVSLELPYKNGIYSWYSGYNMEFRNACPNDYLVWHILEWGAKNGFQFFDFGGAGRPGEVYGPRDFKAKFGGKIVNFGRYTSVHAPNLLALSRISYQFYKEIMYKIPLHEFHGAQ